MPRLCKVSQRKFEWRRFAHHSINLKNNLGTKNVEILQIDADLQNKAGQ